MRGNLVVFLELQATFGVSLELCRGAQGASHVAPGKSSLHSTCEGERGIFLESWQGNRASRCVEGGNSRSFSSCGRKPWVPSNCGGDLRELLMVPMGSQVYCGVWRGLLGLHWVWCNGRGPHLEFRREPQCSSPALMWVSRCVCYFKQEVSYRLVWRHGTLLSSLVVKGVQASRRVEFGTWGSFWISNWGIRTPFVL